MHIAIDARLNAYRQGGIPQYTRQLLTALAEVARDDQITSLQHRDQLRPLAVAPNVVRRTLLTPPHHRLEQWTLPLELLLVRPDVLHCPDFIAPARRPYPAVVTIHDLAFMHYPEILDDAARAYYGQISASAARADGIIAVSEATRQDIAQFLDIPIEEIAVIYEAAAPLYGRLELRPGEARVLNATPVAAGSFMLFVSTLEPRKNLPTLLRALRICLDRRPARPYALVVAGGRGWRDQAIFDTVRELRLGDHVLFAGSVGQYDLRWLYNACRFYVNPSLYEGFGLPLLEAMACGAACLAAATSSLPEIGGEAAIYIPPLDAGLWADAIEELWDDQERQEELGRRGRVQAQHFSWMRAARETLKVYEYAIARARSSRVPADRPALPQPRPTPRYEEPIFGEQIVAAAPGASALEGIPGVAGDARACLRCGTPMRAGLFQRHIAIEPVDEATDSRPLAPRVWACPRCGHVELVAEQVEEAQAAPAEERAPEPAPQEPIEAELAAAPTEERAPEPVPQEPIEAELAAAPAVEGLADEAALAAAPAVEDAVAEAALGAEAEPESAEEPVPASPDALPSVNGALAQAPSNGESPAEARHEAGAAVEHASPNGATDSEQELEALAAAENSPHPTAENGAAQSPAKRRQSRSKRKRA